MTQDRPPISKRDENSTRRIAYIDDDNDVLETFNEVLSEYYEVEIFKSPICFIEAARGKSFDAILIDLNMPKMSGLEMIKSLNQEGIKIPSVVFSGYLNQEVRHEFHQLGVSRLIEKPASVEDLVSAIDDVFHPVDLKKVN